MIFIKVEKSYLWFFKTFKVDLSNFNDENIIGIDQQRVKRRVKRDLLDADVTPNDPLYEQMWYINPNFEQRNEAVTSLEDIRHMNVTGAWALGSGLKFFSLIFKRNFFRAIFEQIRTHLGNIWAIFGHIRTHSGIIRTHSDNIRAHSDTFGQHSGSTRTY